MTQRTAPLPGLADERIEAIRDVALMIPLHGHDAALREEVARHREEMAAIRSTLQEARVLLVRYHTAPMCSKEQRSVCGTCLTLDEIDAALNGGDPSAAAEIAARQVLRGSPALPAYIVVVEFGSPLSRVVNHG